MEFCNDMFQNSPNKINFKQYSRKTSLGAVFAEPFDRTIRVLLKRPVFGKGHGFRIDILPLL